MILPKELLDVAIMIAMLPATFAELSLGIWLLIKKDKLPS
jgi:hypothetical protein